MSLLCDLFGHLEGISSRESAEWKCTRCGYEHPATKKPRAVALWNLDPDDVDLVTAGFVIASFAESKDYETDFQSGWEAGGGESSGGGASGGWDD